MEAKLKERDSRIEKAGRSRYTVEPNLKAGKGGLRDLQLMRWLAQFLYGADAFERWVGGPSSFGRGCRPLYRGG